MTILDIVILCLMVLAGLGGFIRGGKRKLVKWVALIGGLAVGISYAVPSLQTWLTEQTRFNEGVVGLSGWFYNIAWQIINAFKMLVS